MSAAQISIQETQRLEAEQLFQVRILFVLFRRGYVVVFDHVCKCYVNVNALSYVTQLTRGVTPLYGDHV